MAGSLERMAAEQNLSANFCKFIADMNAPAARKPDEVIIRVALAFKVCV